MKVVVLITIVLGLLLGDAALAESNHKRRHKKRDRYNTVAVTNYTGWPEVQETVDDFNRIMPSRGPKLVLVEAGVQPCAENITVCAGLNHPWAGGVAIWGTGDPLGEGTTVLRSDLDSLGREFILCHEMMHLLTHIPDDYVRHNDGTVTWNNPGLDSCVWNYLRDPGSFDVQYLKQTFGGRTPEQEKRHERKKRKHGH
jgi:hypothetical protein